MSGRVRLSEPLSVSSTFAQNSQCRLSRAASGSGSSDDSGLESIHLASMSEFTITRMAFRVRLFRRPA